MSSVRFLPEMALSLDDALFNFLINVWPGELISNAKIRPFLARTFGLKCGHHIQIRKRVYIESYRRAVIGNNVILNRQAFVDATGGITIEDNVRLGPQVMLITGSHEIGEPAMRTGHLIHKPILIKEGCWLGARVFVGPGVTIGRGCIVSAGSVVQRSMPDDFLIAGNPARPIAPLDRLTENGQKGPGLGIDHRLMDVLDQTAVKNDVGK